MKNLAKQYNNPFYIIQKKTEVWQGLTGSTSEGFLKFINNIYGVRAGFINLVEKYLKKGYNTPRKIFLKYSPEDAENITLLVCRKAGLTANQIISGTDIKDLGRAMIEVLRKGKVDEHSFKVGFDEALEYLDIKLTKEPILRVTFDYAMLIFWGILLSSSITFATRIL